VLRVRGREVTVEVNSQQRLTRLLGILRNVGADPVITSEKRIDPAMDFAWASGQRASEGGAAAAAEGWEKFWLDEKVPALLGRTPRQAARGRERPYLEAMLRQFEYEAGLASLDAYSRFGKGRHPAALNFGDCCAYATASVTGEPLLCVGDDFARTDLLLVSPDPAVPSATPEQPDELGH
jgi:hypothetical protein